MSNHDTDRLPAENSEPSVDPVEDRLDSWKEIAAYVRRGVRTVQRWERDSGLPVHRLNRDKRSVVFAFRSEIDGWWVSQSNGGPEAEAPDAPDFSGGSKSSGPKPGSHRWFIASPPMLWILALLMAAGFWSFGTVNRAPQLPDSSAREIALPTNPADPRSQS